METPTMINLEDLKQEIPPKWRIQSVNKNGAICIPYIDSRQAQELLDTVCGQENWQDDYKAVDGKVYAGVGIKINGEWVWKWDVGVESNIEKEKGEASDSFKRACVKWGIGRHCYKMNPFRLRAEMHSNQKFYPFCPEKNTLIFDGDTLTKYIEYLRAKK